MARARRIIFALICAASVAVSGCEAQEGNSVESQRNIEGACDITFRLASLNLGWRDRANQMPPPFGSFTKITQSSDDFSGPMSTYIQAVTREAEDIAKSTYCHSINTNSLLIDLTFISADNLEAPEAELLGLPRHGSSDFDPDTGVLQAIFVRSQVQTLADIYALETEDNSEPKGVAHVGSIRQQVLGYLSDPNEDATALVQWLVENTSPNADDEQKAETIFSKIDTMSKREVEDVYIAVAKTLLRRADPKSVSNRGIGIIDLVGPEVAKKYRNQE